MMAPLAPGALGDPPVVTAGSVIIVMLAYVIILVILVVFGVWGFRTGTGSSGGNGGGGRKKPKPQPPPPPGGRELPDERERESFDARQADFPAWEEQFRESGHEPDEPDRREKVPADAP